MFEKYDGEQQVAVKTLVNAINNNKLSHAYIFETNNYSNSYDFIMSFIKYILCSESHKENHDEANCNICSSINDNNYIELKIINPTTMQIKKEEIIALQDEFKSKAIEGTKKIYLIKNAEKLNNSSANTILKFLEEPEDNIIAILITPSQYLLFDTIISRCQIIFLTNNQDKIDIIEKIYQDNYSNQELTDDLKSKIRTNIDSIFNFIDCIEFKGKDTLLFMNDNFYKYFNDRENVLLAFEIIKLIYYDILKYKTNHKLKYFNDYSQNIENLINKNTIDQLANKLNVINKTIEKIKYNVNINLLMDKFIMEIGGN